MINRATLESVLAGEHRWVVINEDSAKFLREMPDASVDAIVCDPPYELGFMGKSWDASGIAYSVPLWTEALRVLKPGGHLLAFGGSRTYHRMACAIEDAGFQIRDSLVWIYGSGFPKSLDVSKGIDKAAGAKRDVVGSRTLRGRAAQSIAEKGGTYTTGAPSSAGLSKDVPITAPTTDAARQWSGWGTALKPAQEPIVMARKPLAGTIVETVLRYGTGAINVDGCRIPHAGADDLAAHARTVAAIKAKGGSMANSWANTSDLSGANDVSAAGRWPANVLLSHAEACDDGCAEGCPVAELGDFARFFYVAKPSARERDAGLEHLPTRAARSSMNAHNGMSDRFDGAATPQRANVHPTVKPIALMRYLVRLITPPGGLVLDPFAGSGTTGCAAVLEGARFLGLELSPEYAEIARNRISHFEKQPAGLEVVTKAKKDGPANRSKSQTTDSSALTLEDLWTKRT